MTKSDPLRPPAAAHAGGASRAAVAAALVIPVIVAAGITALRMTPGVDSEIAAKILGVTLAVGLDVLALSIAVGIMQLPWTARIRLGLAFSAAEVTMQIVGYGFGLGAGRIIGTVAPYLGFVALAGVGIFIVRESLGADAAALTIKSGWGMLAVCASISLDSLGIGVSLPGVPLPLLPLLSTIAVSTLLFTGVGLAFGARLGERYRQIAERCAGIVLIVLAIVFTIQHLYGWAS